MYEYNYFPISKHPLSLSLSVKHRNIIVCLFFLLNPIHSQIETENFHQSVHEMLKALTREGTDMKKGRWIYSQEKK